MAVPVQTPIKVSTANGITTVFSYDFLILAASDLLVEVDGVAKTLDVDYTVSGVGSDTGGGVTFGVAPVNGATVLRQRNMAYQRSKDYQTNGDMIANELDSDQDAPIMMIQQLAEGLSRSLHLPAGSAFNSQLPPPDPNKLWSWNPTGTAIIYVDTPEFLANTVAGAGFDTAVTEGQSEVTLPAFTATNTITDVYYNGVRQDNAAYIVSGTTLTFSEPLPADGAVSVRYASVAPGLSGNAGMLAYSPNVTGGTARTIQQAQDDRLSVLSLGLTTDGADINAALLAAITNRPVGKKLYFPAGDYALVGRVDVTLTSPLAIEFEPGAKIVGDATDLPMLTVRGGTGRYGVTVRGGQFDNGDRVYNPALQSGTCLDLIDIDDFQVNECVFGRKTRDWLDGFGDSGITATRCQRGTIDSCTFYGQPDLGIYITGGSSTGSSDDYGDIVITGNRFHRCQTGISAKRQLARMIVSANTFYECNNGVTVFEASAIPAGRACVIQGNTIKFTGENAIRVHGQGGHVIANNVIEDFGFNRSLVSQAGRGVWIRGGSHCVISNNLIRFADWTADSNHTAIALAQETFDAIIYTPVSNNVIGNASINVYRGLQESTTGANYYGDNVVTGATVPVTGMNAASIAEFTDSNGKRMFVGATEMARQSATAHFVRNLRFFETATAAAVAANFTATHYIPINANGTTYYLPVRNAVW